MTLEKSFIKLQVLLFILQVQKNSFINDALRNQV